MKMHRAGLRLHAEIHANARNKPWLLMLHGFMQDSRVFQPLIEQVSRFANPITLDLAGHGRSDECSVPDRFAASEQVADVMEWITKLQLGSFLLYGYSMGARLALQILQSTLQKNLNSSIPSPNTSAADGPVANGPMESGGRGHPHLAGVIIESVHPGWFTSQGRSLRQAKEESWVEALHNDPQPFFENWDRNPLFGPDAITQSGDPGSQQISHATSFAASLKGFGTSAMPEVREETFRSAETASIPLLFLAGKNDQPYVELATKMHDLVPSSDLRIVEGAWHRVYANQPKEWLGAMQTFIENNTTIV